MKTKKKLFKVTLDWDASDREQGDFCESVWAKDGDAALKELANRMADLNEVARRDRKDQIAEWISNATPYAVEDVACSVKSDIYDLLAGPGGKLTTEADRAMRVIFDLLAAYGAPGCES